MTPAEQQARLERAVALLKQTDRGYAKQTAAWRANQTTKWWQGLDEIRQVHESLEPPAPPPPPPPVSGTAYYVSSTGDDGASGRTPGAAWRSVARVNRAALTPGMSVLFAGGQSFRGQLLASASGNDGAPIVYTSYGDDGKANLLDGISLASRKWLTFRGLRVDTGDWHGASAKGVTSSSSGTGCQQVVIEDCAFLNLMTGLLIQNRLDRDWTVRRNWIQFTRDNGILIHDPTESNQVGGSNLVFEDNELLDNGVDSSIAWKKHAVYNIGSDTVWRRNTVRRFSEGGFSLRGRGTTVEDNTFTDGPYGVYHSSYDTAGGVTRIIGNTFSNIREQKIAGSSGRVPNRENFVVTDNRGVANSEVRISTSGSVVIERNQS